MKDRRPESGLRQLIDTRIRRARLNDQWVGVVTSTTGWTVRVKRAHSAPEIPQDYMFTGQGWPRVGDTVVLETSGGVVHASKIIAFGTTGIVNGAGGMPSRGVPYCQVRAVGSNSIAHNTVTTLTWSVIIDDTDGMADADAETITVPFDSIWHVKASTRYDSAAGGTRALWVRVGTANDDQRVQQDEGPGGAQVGLIVDEKYRLAAGDVLQMLAFQTSGAALSTQAVVGLYTRFTVKWVRP